MDTGEGGGPDDARRRVSALVAERTGEGAVVLFASAVGSRSYNLHREDGGSDTDFSGVYAADPTAFWGLSRPSATLVASGPVDVQVHEAATFANLLLNGNPAAIEVSIFLYYTK